MDCLKRDIMIIWANELHNVECGILCLSHHTCILLLVPHMHPPLGTTHASSSWLLHAYTSHNKGGPPSQIENSVCHYSSNKNQCV